MQVNDRCINLTNPIAREWLDKSNKKEMYLAYISNGHILPKYSSWITQENFSLYDREVINALVKKIIPLSQFSIDTIENLRNVAFVDPLATAAFFRNTLYFSNKITKSEIAEESFHALVQTIFSTEQKDLLYQAGKFLLNKRLGNQTSDYIKELKDKFPQLDDETVKQYAYEEEIAKDFVTYFNSDSTILPQVEREINKFANKIEPLVGDRAYSISQMIFNFFENLKKLVYSLFKNKLTLQSLFDKIKKSEYANHKVVNTKEEYNIPSFSTYSYSFKNGKLQKLSAIESEQFRNNIFGSAVKRLPEFAKSKVLSWSEIFEQELELWKNLYKQNPDNLYLTYNKIIKNPDYKKELLEDLVELGKRYKNFNNLEFDDDIDEIDNSFVRDVLQSANEKDPTGYSKALREYIQSAGEVLSGTTVQDKLYKVVDPNTIYSAFIRTAENTTSSFQRFKKLINFGMLSDDETNSKIFIKKFITDLQSSFDVDTFYSKVKTLNSFEELQQLIPDINADVYNLVTKGFQLYTRKMLFFAFDPLNNLGQVFDSNSQGLVSQQIKQWSANYNEVKEKYTLDEYKKEFRDVFKEDDLTNNLNNFKEIFDLLGINLSKSLVNEIQKYFNGEPVSDVFPIHNLKYGKKDLTQENLNATLNSLATTIIKGDSYEDLFNETKEAKNDYNSFFRLLSSLNLLYDELAFDSSFDNADGKTIYAHQLGTYTIKKINSLTTEEYIDSISEEDTNFINIFLKKASDKVRQGLAYFSPDGTGIKSYNIYNDSLIEKQSEFQEEENSFTIGSMSALSFDNYRLNVLIAGANKIDNQLFVPIDLGANEASKQRDFVTVPYLKNLVQGEYLTPSGIKRLVAILQPEVDRIKKEHEIATHFLQYLAYKKANPTLEGKLIVPFDQEIDFENLPKEINKYEKQKANFTIKLSDDTLVDYPAYSVNTFNGFNTGRIKAKLVGDKWVLDTVGEKDMKALSFSAVTSFFGDSLLDKIKTSDKTLAEIVFDNNEEVQKNIQNYFQIQHERLDELGVKQTLIGAFSNQFQNLSKFKEDFGFSKDENENINQILFFNHIASIELNRIRVGDLSMAYAKNETDLLKRFRMLNGAIQSIKTDTFNTNLGIYEPVQIVKKGLLQEPISISDIKPKDENGRENKIKSADAQSYVSVQFFRKLAYGLSRLDNSYYFDALEEGKPLSDEDFTKMVDRDLFIKVQKTLSVNGANSQKMSQAPILTKQTTSNFIEIKKEEYEKHADLTSFDDVFRTIQKPKSKIEVSSYEVNGVRKYFKWVEDPSRTTLYEYRMKLEGWEKVGNSWEFQGNGQEVINGNFNFNKDKDFSIDMLSFPEANKTQQKNEAKNIHNITPNTFNYYVDTTDAEFFGLQVENPNHHDMSEPTQGLEIMTNEYELDKEYDLYVDGKKQSLTGKEINEEYSNLQDQRNKNDIHLHTKLMWDGDKLNYKYFYKIAQETLLASGADEQTINFFELDKETGQPLYNGNIPYIKSKFVELYMSMIKKALLQRRKGNALVLVSEHGLNNLKKATKNKHGQISWEVIDRNSQEYIDNINTQNNHVEEIYYARQYFGDNSPSHDKLYGILQKELETKNEYYFIDRLRHNVPEFNEEGEITGWFSEALMPKYEVEQKQLQKSYQYMFGIRIPSQDKSSAVNIKWVGFLDDTLGNAIVLPKEIVEIAGSDFDIDKLYTYFHEGYWLGKSFKRYDNSYSDFLHYIKSNKSFNTVYNDFLEKDENYSDLKNEVKISNYVKQDLKKALDSIKTLSKNKQDLIDDIENLKSLLENPDDIENILGIPLLKSETKKGNIVPQKKFQEQFNTFVEQLQKDEKNLEFLNSTKDFISQIRTLSKELEASKDKINIIERVSFIKTLQHFDLPLKNDDYKETLNSAYISNSIIDWNQQLLTNEHTLLNYDKKGLAIYDKGVSVEPLRDLHNTFRVKKEDVKGDISQMFSDENYVYPLKSLSGENILLNKKQTGGALSYVSSSIYQDSTVVAKGGIGSAVNGMLLNIVGNKLGLTLPEKHQIDINGYKGERFQFLTEEEERVFYNISTIVSGTTDEAKEQQLYEHGITLEGLKVMMTMLGLGYSLGDTVTLINNELVKTYEKQVANITKQIKTRADLESIETKQSIVSKLIPFTASNIEIDNYNFYSRKEDSDILRAYLQFNDIYEELSSFLPVIKSKRGLGKTLQELQKFITDIETLGLGKKPLDKETFFDWRKGFIDNAEVVKNYKTIIQFAYRESTKLQNVMTDFTESFKDIFSSISSGLRNSKKTTVLESLRKDIDTYLFVKYFKNLQGEDLSKDTPKIQQYLSMNLVRDGYFSELFAKVKANNPNAALLKKLIFKSANVNSVRNTENIDKLSLSSLSKLKPEQQKLVRDMFDDLLSSNVEAEKEVALKLFAYFIVKDGIQFRQGSIGKIFPEWMFEDLSKAVDNYLLEESYIKKWQSAFDNGKESNKDFVNSEEGKKISNILTEYSKNINANLAKRLYFEDIRNRPNVPKIKQKAFDKALTDKSGFVEIKGDYVQSKDEFKYPHLVLFSNENEDGEFNSYKQLGFQTYIEDETVKVVYPNYLLIKGALYKYNPKIGEFYNDKSAYELEVFKGSTASTLMSDSGLIIASSEKSKLDALIVGVKQEIEYLSGLKNDDTKSIITNLRGKLLQLEMFKDNKLIDSVSKKQFMTEKKEMDKEKGEEISSYSENLAFGLTNPTHTSPQGYEWKRVWTESQEKWRNYLSKGIEFEGNHYKDVEEAYQKNKAQYNKNSDLFNQGEKTTYDLMVELLTIKLNTYPKLIEEIDTKGGLEYIKNSTHQPTQKNTFWETGGKNMFIWALRKAYLETKNPTKTNDSVEITKENYTIKEVQQNPNTAYVFTENNYSIKNFPNKNGGGSALIRPEPNAYAIVTKKKYDYNTKENVDYTDTYENFTEFTEINTKLIKELKNSGKSKIIFPQGFATDKAKMPTRFAEWLQETLLEEFGLVTELNTTKTGLISKSVNVNKETIQQPVSNNVLSEEEADWLYNNIKEITIKYDSSTLSDSRDFNLKSPLIFNDTVVTAIEPNAGDNSFIWFERKTTGKWLIQISERKDKMYLQLAQINEKGTYYPKSISEEKLQELVKESGLSDLINNLYEDMNIKQPKTRRDEFEIQNQLGYKYNIKRTYKDIYNELNSNKTKPQIDKSQLDSNLDCV